MRRCTASHMQPSFGSMWIDAQGLPGKRRRCNVARLAALDEIDEGPQGRRHVAAARDSRETARKSGCSQSSRTGSSAPLFTCGSSEFLEGGDQAEALDRGGDFQIDAVGDHPRVRRDLHDLAVALELPRRHDAAGEAVADAGMVEQIARMRGRPRRRDRTALRRRRSAARAGRSARRSCPVPAARHSGCRHRSPPPARR